MVDEGKMIDQLADKIIERMQPFIRDTLAQAVQVEVVKALKKTLSDSSFYKSLSEDVVDGVGKIYTAISSAKKELHVDGPIGAAFQAIGQSESILDGVLRMTEDSALQIMDIIEEIQNDIKTAKGSLNSESVDNLIETFDNLDRKLMDILTLLSFQDITGQKIKKLIQALKIVEDIAFELYLQSQAVKKARAADEEIDYEELREKIRQQVSSAKSHIEMVDQEAIDALIDSIDTT